MDKIRILYFLEDRAQEGFITALVKRVAREESIDTDSLIHDIRSSHGGSKVIIEFRNFMKDTRRVGATGTDIGFLVVAIDGNRYGHKRRVEQLKKCIKSNHPFNERVIYAVPDPHIERWYLFDQKAFKKGVGLDKAPDLPAYECKKKDYYKKVLNQALKESNVNTLLGGAEYAEKIVDNITDLKSLGQQNAGFKVFVEDLRRIFKMTSTT